TRASTRARRGGGRSRSRFVSWGTCTELTHILSRAHSRSRRDGRSPGGGGCFRSRRLGSALAVAEGPLLGVAPSPRLFAPGPVNARLWHIALNRANGINEQLVEGRENVFYGYEFATGAAKKLPAASIKYYVDSIANIQGALHGTFGFYTALDTTIAQNQQRMTHRLTMPVLGIGGVCTAWARVPRLR